MKKTNNKEIKSTVNERKVKEENVEVAEGKCRRGLWLRVLCFAGEIPFDSFPMKIVF